MAPEPCPPAWLPSSLWLTPLLNALQRPRPMLSPQLRLGASPAWAASSLCSPPTLFPAPTPGGSAGPTFPCSLRLLALLPLRPASGLPVLRKMQPGPSGSLSVLSRAQVLRGSCPPPSLDAIPAQQQPLSPLLPARPLLPQAHCAGKETGSLRRAVGEGNPRASSKSPPALPYAIAWGGRTGISHHAFLSQRLAQVLSSEEPKRLGWDGDRMAM